METETNKPEFWHTSEKVLQGRQVEHRRIGRYKKQLEMSSSRSEPIKVEEKENTEIDQKLSKTWKRIQEK